MTEWVPRFEPKNDKIEVNKDFGLDDLLSIDENKVLPWEEIVLPSHGLYYDGQVPGGIVKIRPMGLMADKIMATDRLAQSGKALNYLFQHCVKLPNEFDHLNLLIGDRNFIFYYLRGITYGNEYAFTAKCPSCSKFNEYVYDLNNLASKIAWASIEDEEPFKVELPHFSKLISRDVWVKVRYLRGYDTLKMAASMKRKKVNVGDVINATIEDMVDDSLERNLDELIVSVGLGTDISSDKGKIRAFIKKLHSRDRSAVTSFILDNQPGIDTEIELGCTTCDATNSLSLPITDSFFRETKRD